MKPRVLLSSLLASPRAHKALERLVPPIAAAKPDVRDLMQLAAGDADFHKGNYEAALAHYRAVQGEPHLAEARKMAEWIDYKLGCVARGWPAYPVASFDSACGEPAPSTKPGPVFVRNPNQPYEVVHELHLSPWEPDRADGRPLFVWFNFNSSLGGEILAAKIVRAFKRRFDLPLVLVVDDRLQSVLAPNFSDCAVVGKSEDLSRFRNLCSSYILARDVLRYVVRSEEDFAVVAEERFAVKATEIGGLKSGHTKIAISWKTTNRKQGKYRNVPLKAFAQMLRGIDAEFHCVQHGLTAYERYLLKRHLGERMRFNTIPTVGSVDDLAAGLSAMNGVLTIDNSVLHIAGAFGVPTVALLSIPSYWAWPISGESSRWYPSVSLVHQTSQGAWDEVLVCAQSRLAEWTGRPRY